MINAVGSGLCTSPRIYRNRANTNYIPTFCGTPKVIPKAAGKTMRRIAIGSDHGGFDYKQKIIQYLREKGIEVVDVGTHSKEACDYPDYVKKVALAVQKRKADGGVLVCTSGTGVSIAANRFDGIYAVPAHSLDVMRPGCDHNNINVLCLGEKIPGDDKFQILQTWLDTPFSNAERHVKRLYKVDHIRSIYNVIAFRISSFLRKG